MKILQIELHNFGSYAGKNVFDLSNSSENQRVVVIGGKNGAGKTTLFTAIQVGLYGNYAFGFKTVGRHYLKQIYSLINNQAKIDEAEKAYVSILFEHITNGEKQIYMVQRSWSWDDGKVSEALFVERNGVELVEDDLLNFQNYLIHLIPPDLLKLYFFDGEKIADYFLGDQTINIQKALMILSGNDTFEIIEENVRRILGQTTGASSDAAVQYLTMRANLVQTEHQLFELQKSLAEKVNASDLARADLQHLVEEYSAKGGISLTQWTDLHNALKEEEEKRERINWQRKEIATDILPFLILRDKLNKVQPQIIDEKEFIADKALRSKIENKAFSETIKSVIDSFSINQNVEVSTAIAEKLKSILLDKDWDKFVVLFGLSAEDERQVLAVVDRVLRTDPKAMRSYRRRLTASLNRSKKIRETLQNSSVESFEEFAEERNAKVIAIQKLETDIDLLQKEVEYLQCDVIEKQSALAGHKKTFEESLKKQSVATLSGRLILLMEELQDYLFVKLISAVEADLKTKFGQLIRKKDFFDDIQIDRDWNVHIIRNEFVEVKDLVSLLEKGDLKLAEKKLGSEAIKRLKDLLGDLPAQGLISSLNTYPESVIGLPTEVDKDRMSSGEKQIFVMSLYWALMQQSKSTLPFIIDTPFARIDTEHRHNITENFFMNLKGQLFVLSTDEELSGNHLSVMESQVSHVYMLDYGDDRCTHIKANQYFEV